MQVGPDDLQQYRGQIHRLSLKNADAGVASVAGAESSAAAPPDWGPGRRWKSSRASFVTGSSSASAGQWPTGGWTVAARYGFLHLCIKNTVRTSCRGIRV